MSWFWKYPNRILTGSKPPGPASKTGATPLGKGSQSGGKGGGSSGKGGQAQGKGGGGAKTNAQNTHQVKLHYNYSLAIFYYI